MFDRLGRALQGALDPDKVGQVHGRQPTLETLLPGDVVSLWDDGDCVVDGALDCSETLNDRETVWRWNLLDGGRMIEVSPDGTILYRRTAVLHQSSAEFETLTADSDVGGVLKAFEARVREGTAARNPTLFEYEGRTYRIVSTGTFDARPASGHTYPSVEVWRDVNPTNPGDNVYFGLEPTGEGAEESEENEVLGIWTTHIALLFGRPLKNADIQSIYPGTQQPEGHVK